ncbi:hypothetical protein D8B46_06110 [Candidatus Gracilibacteria bacterium]|nr:MAG: hypothetical protein D8B46_06110 [Candidatus Gracilibacteria bacterium]
MKKILIAILVLVILGVAGYFTYEKYLKNFGREDEIGPIVEGFLKSKNVKDFIKYNFDNSLKDSLGNSKIVPGDNFQTQFGKDENGTFWQWSTQNTRGGGFFVDIPEKLEKNYIIVLKFSPEETEPNWKKIIDYKNKQSDNGLYFYGGRVQFFPDLTLGKSIFKNNELLTFVIDSSEDGKLTVYNLKDNIMEKELGIPLDTEKEVQSFLPNGKAILGFFVDDVMSTSGNGIKGGKVYSLQIYNK